MACKRSGVRLPLAPPPSRWKLGTQTIRLKRTAANWPVSRWIPPFVNRFRSLIAGRAVSPVPALPWRALQLARRSFVRPDWPPPARPPRGALCRCDDAPGGILFRRCRGKGPVWDSYLARVNRDSAGVPQHEGLAGSNFEALQVPIPQSCPAGPAALALLPAPPESLEVPQEAASRAWEEPMSAAWSSTPSPNPATDGAASATASASIPSRGTSINGISRTAGPAKAAACAVAAGQALGSTMMPAPASTAAAMSFLASSSPRVTRTAIRVPVPLNLVMVGASLARASSLRSGGTASSTSNTIASAPRQHAPRGRPSSRAGTKRSDRHIRSRRLDAVRRSGPAKARYPRGCRWSPVRNARESA